MPACGCRQYGGKCCEKKKEKRKEKKKRKRDFNAINVIRIYESWVLHNRAGEECLQTLAIQAEQIKPPTPRGPKLAVAY